MIFDSCKSTFNWSVNFQLLLIKVILLYWFICMKLVLTISPSVTDFQTTTDIYVQDIELTTYYQNIYTVSSPRSSYPTKPMSRSFWWYFTFCIELLKAIKVLYLWKDIIITWYKAVLFKVRRLRSWLAYWVITAVKLYLLIPIHSLIMASLEAEMCIYRWFPNLKWG